MAKQAVRTLIKYIDPKINEEILEHTPENVVNSFDKIFAGYKTKIENLIEKPMENNIKYNGNITINQIPFRSICEHHLLPMRGFVDIIYIPDQKILGIGEFTKIVDFFSQRLQIQEVMTIQITDYIENLLNPLGLCVKIQATHECSAVENDKFCQNLTTEIRRGKLHN